MKCSDCGRRCRALISGQTFGERCIDCFMSRWKGPEVVKARPGVKSAADYEEELPPHSDKPLEYVEPFWVNRYGEMET